MCSPSQSLFVSDAPFSVMQVDPAVLQFQNQKLSQQLDVQKERIQDLEAKLQGVEQKQASYDANLIAVNRIWGQVRPP